MTTEWDDDNGPAFDIEAMFARHVARQRELRRMSRAIHAANRQAVRRNRWLAAVTLLLVGIVVLLYAAGGAS